MNGCRIQLSRCTPIASGNNRDVFAHPQDPDLLIKTVKPEAWARRSVPGTFGPKRWFRRYKQYLPFLRECQEHIASHLDGDLLPGFVQTLVGFVETDRGLGLVYRAERNRSGAYAQTLAKLIAAGLFDEEARRALDTCLQSFLASNVIITGLDTNNLVYAYSEERGAHFVIIDGYGEKNLIPFNSISTWCNRRNKRKRIMSLRHAVAQAIRRREDTCRAGSG